MISIEKNESWKASIIIIIFAEHFNEIIIIISLSSKNNKIK